MARMYPTEIDPETKSDAERLLYNQFQQQLPDEYIVFHSVAWQSPGVSRPTTLDGEADFVIAHPQLGIIVVEAKGGVIRFDAVRHLWTSTERSGRINQIKDPFLQAKNNKYSLRELIRGRLRTGYSINLGHGVAFPDAAVIDTFLGLDEPREIVLDATNLGNLKSWVDEALDYWRGQADRKYVAPGEQVIRMLVELLAKSWELRPVMWGDIVREQNEQIRLTREQFRILDSLDRRRRAIISGCAGSGKTLVATEKALRLAKQGFNVLLTCYNTNLAMRLRERIKHDSNLQILTFHELCYDFSELAGILPSERDESDYYERQLPEALMRSVEKLSNRYDAIIVDEGQDFREEWWIPILALLSDAANGILYIFYDDNQKLYDRPLSFPIAEPPYLLTTNCRNTQILHEVILKFYVGENSPQVQGPLGRPVEIVEYDDATKVRVVLRNAIRRLTQEQRVPPQEIAVLSPLSRERSLIWTGKPANEPKLTDHWNSKAEEIYATTIYQCKGLERGIIILAEIDYDWLPPWMDLNNLLYVACSRARNHLVVLLKKNGSPELRNVFLTKLIDTRPWMT